MEEYTQRLEADYEEEKMKTEQLLYQLLPRYYLKGTGISCKEKKIARKIFKCVYLSLIIITKLFLKSESLLLFKLN